MKRLHSGGLGRIGDRETWFAYQSIRQRSYAFGRLLVQQTNLKLCQPTVVIGALTSATQKPFDAAVQHGLEAAGVDTVLCGLLPIPAITYLTRANKHQACVVVNDAWHPDWNDYVGFFSPEGICLLNEAPIRPGSWQAQKTPKEGSYHTGNTIRLSQPGATYIAFCKGGAMQQLNLNGLNIVVDTAHGSAREVAPKVFHELGAKVIAIGLTTCGLNAPECAGASVSQQLAWTVCALRADVGISINREGNVLTMVDSNGQVHCENRLRFITNSTLRATDDAIVKSLQVLAQMQSSRSSLLQVMMNQPVYASGL